MCRLYLLLVSLVLLDPLLGSAQQQRDSFESGLQIRKSNPGAYPDVRPSDAMRRKIAELEDLLPKWMHDFHVPGVSIALIEERQLVWSRGYGVRCAGNDAQVHPTTVMEACSMSKPFFAHLFLQLVQQEKADLDRPLIEYIGKDYLKDESRHKKITARMALSHTSGLPNWRRGGSGSGGPMSLAFDPGTKFRYSGEGFLMLQRAAEALTDTKLDAMSKAMLINPLGLSHTRYVWDDRLMANAACGHDREGALKADRRYYRSANAAYTLYTSAENYARFLVEIMKTDRTAKRSLSSQMVDRMLTPISHRQDQDADWGLGWGLRGANPEGNQRKVVYHSGANGSGFRCYSEFQPNQGDGLVILTNAIGGKELHTALVEQWHAEGAMPVVSSAEDWSREKLADAKAFSETLDTAAVVIMHDGDTVDEWGDVALPLKCHSTRKSILSALFGPHVEAGTIDLDATLKQLGINDCEPSLTEVERGATIRDLLKARSGIYHPALYETASMAAKRPKRGSHLPNTFWYYNNWDFNASCTIFQNLTGRSIFEEFESRFAIPLRMQDFRRQRDTRYVTGDDSVHPAYPFRLRTCFEIALSA